MTREQLFNQIRLKKSFLCVGLDPELTKLPDSIKHAGSPLYEFNRQIIDQTHDLAVAFKINVAFYECMGASGWAQLEQTVGYLRSRSDLFIIADAKRSDIGNTARKYAEAYFSHLDADAVTVNPYMGSDSVLPFLEYKGKWVIILALTSNPGAADFQMISNGENRRLFESVLLTSKKWGSPANTMYVIGANHSDMLLRVREIIPEHFLLIPGVGTQGGDLMEVSRSGMNGVCGLLVNSSRDIIYASAGDDFAAAARHKAFRMQQRMESLLQGNF